MRGDRNPGSAAVGVRSAARCCAYRYHSVWLSVAVPWPNRRLRETVECDGCEQESSGRCERSVNWPGIPFRCLLVSYRPLVSKQEFNLAEICSRFLGVGALKQACIAIRSSFLITDQRELTKLSTARRQTLRHSSQCFSSAQPDDA